ncbi:MAG: mechanosensitive ion channel family protein [Clostridia bacterium]|nr:mechanosensitive ion channel family protein [Clostridia bacterium]
MEKKKFNVGAFITLLVLVAATVVIYVFSGKIFGEESVFNKTLGTNTFVNTLYNKIPALLKTVQIVAIAWLLIWGFRVILVSLLSKSNRGATIAKLVNNFLKYLIAIIAFLMILSAWGVDTRTLVASAGILSLIIGLGAQSLISDIIAGIFIVFEGEFQVGDIVIIDGWRGTVDEIGIRSTKVIDWQGNIKIVNNSQISTVINQSKELSVTTCEVAICYQESIPKVELIIKNNLDKIKEAIPEIVEGPYYKGVNSLAESSVNLLFIATVKESDYYVVQRALNREIKIMFDRNGISIPFPQVTINQPDKPSDPVSERDEKNARTFNAEQREISKTMEDMNL